jgi:lipopolysaccharide export system protein LptA
MIRLRPLTPLSVALIALAVVPALRAVEEQPTNITCDGEGQMVSTDKETTITFRTNVVVTGTNLKLTCDYLEVVVKRTGDPSATLGKLDKFRSLLATGNVHIIQGDREAACGRAEVLPEQDRIVLTENPVIVDRDQNTRMTGEKITMLRGQRQVFVEKPVLTGPPVKDLGYDRNKPTAPAPAAEPPKQP